MYQDVAGCRRYQFKTWDVAVASHGMASLAELRKQLAAEIIGLGKPTIVFLLNGGCSALCQPGPSVKKLKALSGKSTTAMQTGENSHKYTLSSG